MAGPTPEPEDFGRCHACGAGLRVEDHYYLETRSHEDSHRDSGSAEHGVSLELRWVHLPCPHCGEPRPINALRHTWRQVALMFGFGALVLAFLAAIAWPILV